MARLPAMFGFALPLLLAAGGAWASPATATLVKTGGTDMVFETGSTSATTTEKMRITTAGVISASAFKGNGSQITNAITPTTPVAFTANKNASDQTVSANVTTKITFTNEVTDTHNYYSTFNSRFTPKVAGIYLFTNSIVVWNDSGEGWFSSYFRKNGSGSSYLCYVGNWGTYFMNNFSCPISMNGTTDYVEVYSDNTNSYGNWTVGGDISSSTFSAILIR
jgi:hypothetical protein